MAKAAYRTRAYRAFVAWLQANPDVPCWWGCGRRAEVPDHAIPLALGGSDEDLVPSCAPCNQRRGSQLGVRLLRARQRTLAARAVGPSRSW